MVITFAFSLGNVTRLGLELGITVWIAWLVGPAVDLSVIGLLVGMRFLCLHGYKDDELAGLRRMLRFCGLRTLALNTAFQPGAGGGLPVRLAAPVPGRTQETASPVQREESPTSPTQVANFGSPDGECLRRRVWSAHGP
jgi:hypothetical protein